MTTCDGFVCDTPKNQPAKPRKNYSRIARRAGDLVSPISVRIAQTPLSAELQSKSPFELCRVHSDGLEGPLVHDPSACMKAAANSPTAATPFGVEGSGPLDPAADPSI